MEEESQQSVLSTQDGTFRASRSALRRRCFRMNKQLTMQTRGYRADPALQLLGDHDGRGSPRFAQPVR